MNRILILCVLASLGAIGCDTTSDQTDDLVGIWSAVIPIFTIDLIDPIVGEVHRTSRYEYRHTYAATGEFIRLILFEDSTESGSSWHTQAEAGSFSIEGDTVIHRIAQTGAEDERVTDISEITFEPATTRIEEFVFSIHQDSLILTPKECFLQGCPRVSQIGLKRTE